MQVRPGRPLLRAAGVNSLPRFTTVLVPGSALFALLDSYGFEPDPSGSGLLVVCLVWFLVFGSGLVLLVLIVRLILRTPHLNSSR